MNRYHVPKQPPDWVIERIRRRLVCDGDGLKWVDTGKTAGYRNSKGYIEICFGGTRQRRKKHVKVHHIVWFLNTGEWPTAMLDHKDLNRANNTFENLRIATMGQNKLNANARRDNKLGIKNICLHPCGKYSLQIQCDDHRVSIYFDSLDEAIAERDRILATHIHIDFVRA